MEWPSCRRSRCNCLNIGASAEPGRRNRHMASTAHRLSLIQKGEGSAPQKLRPIGLMASVYRLWASLRIRDNMHWQEKWADTMFGWICRFMWNLHSSTVLIWLACRLTGVNVLTECHKESPSSSLRVRGMYRELRKMLPQMASFKVVL